MCTNNPAERPFAVAKAYLQLYGRMDLVTLARFTLSVCNGSHRMAEPKGKQNKTRHRSVQAAGIAITSDARLCAVRRKKPGALVLLLKTAYQSDKVLDRELRLANEENEKARMAKKHLNKAIKFNNAVEEPLAMTVLLFQTELKAMDYKKAVCLAYLKRQFDARVIRAEADGYNYDGIPARFRSVHTGKLVKNPPLPGDPMTYLSELVRKMITIDSKLTFSDDIALSGLIRCTPVLEPETTNPIATDAKKAMDEYLVV